MLIGWEVLCGLCLSLLCWLWLRLWLYWWLRGVTTYGLPPPIGCLLQIWFGGRSIIGMIQHVFNQNPSSSVIGTWILTKPVLIVKDLRLVHKIMTEESSAWPDRGFKDDTRLDPLSSHLVNLGGRRWRLLRTWTAPGLGLVGLRSRHNIMLEEAERMLRSISSSGKFDVLRSTRNMTLTILNRTVIGLSESPPGVEALISEAFKGSLWTTIRSFARLSCPGIITAFGSKRFEPSQEFSFLNLVSERIQKEESEFQDFLQILINSYKKYIATNPPNEGVTESVVASTAFGLLAAGYDTTASSLTWGLLELARQPEIQDRIHEELHTVLATHGEPSQTALADMPYLDNVVSEMLRMYPAVPLTGRVAAKSTTLGELVIPAGLRIFIPIYTIHRDPSYFPNPDLFDPDRFSNPDFHRKAYLPFGKGPRICIGWRMAVIMMKISLVTILKDFSLTVAPETVFLPTDFVPNTLFLTPRQPIMLNLHPRYP